LNSRDCFAGKDRVIMQWPLTAPPNKSLQRTGISVPLIDDLSVMQ